MSTTLNEKTEVTVEKKVRGDERYEGIVEYDTPAYKPRKRRFGDRYDGRLLRSLPAISKLMPYLMKVRADSQNQFEAEIDITNIEHYLQGKKKEGYTDMSLLHVIIAAYVRIVAERPGVHRFIAGQKIYSRNKLECLMTIKKDMTLEELKQYNFGYYFEDDKIGFHPYHHAGLIYVQEPAAMAPAECVEIEKNWHIADICATT